MSRVSVIMAAWQAEATIADAIRSVLAQTWEDVEVLVVDDASTDGTVAVVEGIDDPRVVLLQQPTNQGPGPARNRALEVCTGGWITFLDADDLYHPERLARLVAIAEEHGEQHVYGDAIYWWRPPGTLRAVPLEPPHIFDTVDAAGFVNAGRSIHAFFARSLWERTQARQPALLAGEDIAFVLRMLAPTGGRVHYVSGKTYVYRVVEGTLTGAVEQPARVLAMVALLQDELGHDPALAEALAVHARKLVPEAYYRVLRGHLREGAVTAAVRHALTRPDLLARAPVRLGRSRLKRLARRLVR